MSMDKSAVEKIIAALLVIAIALGVVTGYYFNAGDNTLIFVPMILGIIVVFVLTYFVDLRNKLVFGEEKN